MRRPLSLAAVAALVASAACAASAPTPVTPGVTSGVSAAPPATSSSASTSSPIDAGLAAPAPSATPEAPAASTNAVPSVEPGPAAAVEADAGASASACNEQAPQDFLIRGNFLKQHDGNERAIQYRTEQYGYFKGFGHPSRDAQPPTTQVVSTSFMGLPVRMHRKVVPALACVEKEIERACVDHPYTPHALAGIRYRNTYRGGEVTNHAYGIAIDIDPSMNTCCGCVPPWNDAPACKRPGKNEYDHMAMPECWVHAFERFGFYWLGHDVLKDTMHFEFLGDPDKISRP
jgi:hypothetical protein